MIAPGSHPLKPLRPYGMFVRNDAPPSETKHEKTRQP